MPRFDAGFDEPLCLYLVSASGPDQPSNRSITQIASRPVSPTMMSKAPAVARKIPMVMVSKLPHFICHWFATLFDTIASRLFFPKSIKDIPLQLLSFGYA
jgi:hypothetical protein